MTPLAGRPATTAKRVFPHREPQDDLNPLHPWVHDFKPRRIVLKDLITGIAVSPWASKEPFREVEQAWAKIRGYDLPVAHGLNSPFTPNIEEFVERGWGRP